MVSLGKSKTFSNLRENLLNQNINNDNNTINHKEKTYGIQTHLHLNELDFLFLFSFAGSITGIIQARSSEEASHVLGSPGIERVLYYQTFLGNAVPAVGTFGYVIGLVYGMVKDRDLTAGYINFLLLFFSVATQFLALVGNYFTANPENLDNGFSDFFNDLNGLNLAADVVFVIQNSAFIRNFILNFSCGERCMGSGNSSYINARRDLRLLLFLGSKRSCEKGDEINCCLKNNKIVCFCLFVFSYSWLSFFYLNVRSFSKIGEHYMGREWFNIPLSIICSALVNVPGIATRWIHSNSYAKLIDELMVFGRVRFLFLIIAVLISIFSVSSAVESSMRLTGFLVSGLQEDNDFSTLDDFNAINDGSWVGAFHQGLALFLFYWGVIGTSLVNMSITNGQLWQIAMNIYFIFNSIFNELDNKNVKEIVNIFHSSLESKGALSGFFYGPCLTAKSEKTGRCLTESDNNNANENVNISNSSLARKAELSGFFLEPHLTEKSEKPSKKGRSSRDTDILKRPCDSICSRDFQKGKDSERFFYKKPRESICTRLMNWFSSCYA